VLVLLNKNSGLQFGLVQHIHDTQYLLDLKKITFVVHQTWHAFLGRGDEDIFHCDDCCLVLGS
jgi:hypothetical protein